ncbi:phosphoribosylglycinamide formyltransferase [Vagococcus xieshaowenii]|uniref:Phosphoribosylglycinamide formyltransferase n=1 Tax=Vagococcus xieshaowenii TaxID=2562451 RepID=A0AAJ5JQY2_9ENTE|nr:phosphoribosylglycinamide formyltransferase [Vagococcus xieshaowenii]QCA28802.1 phosphoribosylglycinamide formyltransferase [Vagococcus xieshaowenii]TFZ42997.1 phosphoribosylglycinamide formyltransferase [Vagococcus xieshaowenii]
MKKIAILASGNGSNFEAIMKKIQSNDLQAEVVIVFSDQSDAYVLERAKQYDIPFASFSPKDFDSKVAYEAELLALLRAYEVEFVVLAGYLRILGPEVIHNFSHCIVNIHPSLLPDYPGLRSIERAYLDGQAVTGVTIHYVDEGLDTGPMIRQASLAIDPDDSLERLEERVHQLEHQLYPEVLQQLLNKELNES